MIVGFGVRLWDFGLGINFSDVLSGFVFLGSMEKMIKVALIYNKLLTVSSVFYFLFCMFL